MERNALSFGMVYFFRLNTSSRPMCEWPLKMLGMLPIQVGLLQKGVGAKDRIGLKGLDGLDIPGLGEV